MPEPIAVIPRVRALAQPTSTNGFTIGRRYTIKHHNGRVATVFNDNGHERIVGLDEANSAHIVESRDYPMRGSQVCVGYFEVIYEGGKS